MKLLQNCLHRTLLTLYLCNHFPAAWEPLIQFYERHKNEKKAWSMVTWIYLRQHLGVSFLCMETTTSISLTYITIQLLTINSPIVNHIRWSALRTVHFVMEQQLSSYSGSIGSRLLKSGWAAKGSLPQLYDGIRIYTPKIPFSPHVIPI
jgi:hypothetical protein